MPILIKGILINEINIQRELKQEDPLGPFIFLLVVVVKVTQNWSFVSFKIGDRIWLCFFSLLVCEKSVVEEQNQGLNLSTENITETYFWAEICSYFMRDTVTINIDFVSV